jgi:hypothetical protein
LTTCICETEWCSEARASHLFRNSLVTLSNDPYESDIWLNHLEVVDIDDINRVQALKLARVWIGHFHVVDYEVGSDHTTKNVYFIRIDFGSVTKFQDYNTGCNSKSSPPRPSVTQADIYKSRITYQDILSYEDYVILNSVNIDSKRKRKSIEAPVEEDYKTPGKERVPGIRRRRGDIYHHSFIGMADQLIDLIRAVNSHGQNCKGQILFRDTSVVLKRFTLILKCKCSLGKECNDTEWNNGHLSHGHLRWQSVNDMEISPGRSVFTTDVLYAHAVTVTPNSMAHGQQLLDAMFLLSPSRDLLKEIIVKKVDPYLVNMKKQLVDERIATIGNKALIVSMDCGFNHARNAEGATLCIACGLVVVETIVDVVVNAWSKEAVLVKKALDWLIIERGLDVAFCKD